MSVLKTLLDVTLSDSVKLVTEARRRVKPYLPLAAELYNELATRSPVSLPKIDVDKLIDDLYPKQDLDPAWAQDAEPSVPSTPDEPEVEEVEEPAVDEVVAEEATIEATVAVTAPVEEPAPVVVEAPAASPVAEAVVAAAPAVEPAPAVVEVPAPAPVVVPAPAKAPAKAAKAAEKVAEKTPEKPAAKPKAKPRSRKKDDAQQTLIAPAPVKPRYTLDGLLEMKKADLLDLARERKLDLKPSATKQAIAEAILGA